MQKLFSRLSLFVVGLFVLTPMLSSQEPKTPVAAPTNEFFPLKPGMKWTYSVTNGEVVVEASGPITVGNENCIRLETKVQGKTAASEDLVIRADGVYRKAVNNVAASKDILVLKAGAKKGDSWEVKSSVQGQEIEGTYVVKEEDVKAGGKDYKNCLLIEGQKFKVGNLDSKFKMWLSKGVGIVKLEFSLGGQEASMELSKFESKD